MNSTMDLSLLCFFIHISGDNIRENYRYKFSPPFNLSGNQFKIGLICMNFS